MHFSRFNVKSYLIERHNQPIFQKTNKKEDSIMGAQNISIFGQIANWCGSVTGILTILIIATTANRMILTAIREKHGKESMFYRNSKLISGTIYLIFFVNCLGAISRWLFGLVMQTKTQIGTTIATNSDFVTRPAILTTILIIFYIVITASALKRVSMAQTIIAAIVLIAGIYIIHGSVGLTIGVGIFAIIVIVAISDGLSSADESETEREPLTKKGIFLIITWAASVVAAYMAGEYSLVPKAIEYVQNHFKKGTKPATEETAEEEEKAEAEVDAVATE